MTKQMFIILPLIILQLILAIFSLIHVLKHPHYRYGNKIIWCLVVVLIQFIGPLIYFTIGREQ